MSGTVLGTAAFWVRTPHFPVPYLPFAVLGAFAVALVFASVASVLAAMVLILVAKHGAMTLSRLRLAVTGATTGAIAGALHPFVFLVAIVRALSPESAAASVVPLSLAALVAVSGAVAGALLALRYVPTIRARA